VCRGRGGAGLVTGGSPGPCAVWIALEGALPASLQMRDHTRYYTRFSGCACGGTCITRPAQPPAPSPPLLPPQTFEVLNDEGINVVMLSQGASKTNISLVVEGCDGQRAVKALHEKLFQVGCSASADSRFCCSRQPELCVPATPAPPPFIAPAATALGRADTRSRSSWAQSVSSARGMRLAHPRRLPPVCTLRRRCW